MLLRFGLQNYRSIKTYQELSLVATSLRDSEDGLFEIAGGRYRLNPIVALYGANASGKSNLLKGLGFFIDGIVKSHTRVANNEGTPYSPFLLDDYSSNQPSSFDVDVIIGENRYHYGYALDGKSILKEWLYSFDLTAKRQSKTVLFYRDPDQSNDIYFGKSLKGENKVIEKLVRKNSLFLSAAAQNSHPQLTPIYDYFYKKVAARWTDDVRPELIADQIVAYFGNDRVRRSATLDFLRSADFGISDIDFSKVPVSEKTQQFLQEFEQFFAKHLDEKISFGDSLKERSKVELLHSGENGKSYPLRLDFESAGTLAALQVIGPALARLTEGGLFIIDELNSKLHPIVARALVGLFGGAETNPGRAQLLFSTHDTNLLTGDLLRRDEVWFAEKDTLGASVLYPLSDFQTRAQDNFEKGYLSGRFGAIPFMVGGALANFSRAVQNIGVKEG